MPSAIHECFIWGIEREISLQLDWLSADISKPEIAALARSVVFRRSTDITVCDPTDRRGYSKKSPDSSLGHSDIRFPSVVIEVSYSQRRKDLPDLADKYIIGSCGNVRIAIGLDFEYRRSKEATVSVWQPDRGFNIDGTPYLAAKQVTEYALFRNSDSSPVLTDAALMIPMSVFIPPTTTLHSPLPHILIPYTTLYTILHKAEIQHQISGVTLQETEVPGTEFKWRQSTPEEQLTETDEAKYAAMEDSAIRKADKADSTWSEKPHRGKKCEDMWQWKRTQSGRLTKQM